MEREFKVVKTGKEFLQLGSVKYNWAQNTKSNLKQANRLIKKNKWIV